MFTSEQFEELHSLWDGTCSNVKEVCGNCGACCHNEDKTLYPGEYAYLVEKTGQHNTLWNSVGCLCMQVKVVKPIICKTFPLDFIVNFSGDIVINWDVETDYYSSNCKKLIYTASDRQKAQKFFDYLFSDVQNRLLFLLKFKLEDMIVEEKKMLGELGHKMPYKDIQERVMYKICGLDLKEHLSHYKF